MKGPVRDLVARAGWEEKYGKWIKFNTLQAALEEITNESVIEKTYFPENLPSPLFTKEG